MRASQNGRARIAEEMGFEQHRSAGLLVRSKNAVYGGVFAFFRVVLLGHAWSHHARKNGSVPLLARIFAGFVMILHTWGAGKLSGIELERRWVESDRSH